MMLGNFKRAKLIFLAVLSSLLVSVSAFAQIPRIPQNTQLIKSQITVTQLRNATTRLNQLETALNQVERKKVATLKDTEQVEQAAFAYAEAIKAGLDNALKEAETLAKTEGKQGSINSLVTFEKAEKANQPRLEKIEQRANTIERQIKVGTIRLDKSIIQNLSVTERRELLESIEPPAKQIYLREQPTLFKPALELQINNPTLQTPQINPTLQTPRNNLKFLEDKFDKFQSFVPANIENTLANYHIGIAVSGMMQSISNMLIPPAYAAAAIPCIGYAVAGKWTALAACVVKAGSEATSIYNQFVSCWNNAKRPFRWLKRSRCVARLIVRIA
ncbi:hypothetical protein [Nodularia spumigena]|jgi:hypothetical protein|uniref:Chromosome partition protein Smc n=1 Tax=Nodularia spumigena UHCC 0039 TaxID=1914872 RepID=A0A2S0Q6P2_NODSP|nr:hypothetical protein [Nodularia spumigena]AVZ30028.1 hypothetical protein BMF81_01173 [Nodularia spumigena UHCC 0039]MEA5525739.1 hypothetical protein [Nodularia spumigena UHCC 0143]MEA5555708.1 hypothetical protein [Nodularia spumigena CH309]MEA5611311.1 hypothetical protein [Nodularia spumigena UHCC 0040]